jgi:hypothetical protein
MGHRVSYYCYYAYVVSYYHCYYAYIESFSRSINIAAQRSLKECGYLPLNAINVKKTVRFKLRVTDDYWHI